jgi:hypothetical protein
MSKPPDANTVMSASSARESIRKITVIRKKGVLEAHGK